MVATDELLTYYLIQNGTWDTNMQLTNNSVRKKISSEKNWSKILHIFAIECH